jgi:hypothetical protein
MCALQKTLCIWHVKGSIALVERHDWVLGRTGFILIPYENCVVNKMIDGTQCSLAGEDLKLSHAKQQVLVCKATSTGRPGEHTE